MVASIDYIIQRLEALGFDEFKGEFNEDNMPRSFRDRQFHLRYETASPGAIDQFVQQVDIPVKVYIGFSLSRDSDDKKQILERSEEIICELGKTVNLTNSGVIRCIFTGLSMEQPDENRRFVLLNMEFNLRSLIALR